MKILSTILRVLAAVIMLQSLYFKFTAHPSSVALFTQLGIEPFGRIGIGILELIASILLLVPKTSWLGAGLTFGLMSGAIFSHLTTLGIVVDGDALLFIYACIAWTCAILWLIIKRNEWVVILKKVLRVG